DIRRQFELESQQQPHPETQPHRLSFAHGFLWSRDNLEYPQECLERAEGDDGDRRNFNRQGHVARDSLDCFFHMRILSLRNCDPRTPAPPKGNSWSGVAGHASKAALECTSKLAHSPEFCALIRCCAPPQK